MKIISLLRTALLSAAALFMSSIAFTSSVEAYNAPIGIPDPGMWGSIHPIDSMAPETAAKCPAWPSGATANCYYIDNANPKSTDTGNAYGYPDKPRISIPTVYAAGAYIEVHGGPYTGAQLIMTLNCTAESPCWFRGKDENSRPVIRRETIIKGAYIILENLHYDSGHTIGLRNHSTSTLHHVVVRNSELARVSISGRADYTFHDFIVYKNNVHLDNFVNLGPNSPEFKENDTHGVSPGSYSENTWILDNDIHDVAGDAVGNAHGARYTARNIYVGRNLLHDDGEDSVDFKEVENLVVSQNKMYNNYGPSTGSGGGALVLHYGPTYSPRNAWVFYNEIYDCSDVGIQIGGDVTDPVYVIGNIIHDISNASGTGKGFSSWNSSDIHLDSNVLYGNDKGVSISNTNGSTLYMSNNIVANNKNSSAYHLALDNSIYRANAQLRNNIFYQANGIVRIQWGSAYDLAGFMSSTGKCTDCLEADPGFVNPSAYNFSLNHSSPAIDAGATDQVYDLYKFLFGKSIAYDFVGISRPQGSARDIGAYEFEENIASLSSPLRGDVNNSGAIDSADAMLILRKSLGLQIPGASWSPVAATGDVNCDGTISASDALLVLRFSLEVSMDATGWCDKQ